MKVSLLDVNVLIALSWSNHINHARALRWFSDHVEEEFATCPITEAGFIRLSMNPQVVGEPVSYASAVAALKLYQNHPRHVFWPADAPLTGAAGSFPVPGYRQVTDAYLLGLAVKKGGRLVTMDKKMVELVKDDPLLASHLLVIGGES